MSALSNFSLPQISGDDLSDSRKVKAILDALRMLDENLRYAMYNMTPEDNFSQSALNAYNGLRSSVEKLGEDGKTYKTLIEQNEEKITLEAQRATAQEIELAAAIAVQADQIALKVEKGAVIAAINLSPEEVAIKAEKINLNGAVTANNYFKINLDGSVETSAIKIGGKNSKIDIQTSDRTYDVIALNYTENGVQMVTGLKPDEVRSVYGSLTAVMNGDDGFSYYSIDGSVDATYGKNAVTKGYGEFGNGVYIGSNSGLATRYGNAMLIQDYGNGTVAYNAAGTELLLGMTNTDYVRVVNALRFRVGNPTTTTDVPKSIECQGDIVTGGNMSCAGDFYCWGNLHCYGAEKNRVVKTSKGNVAVSAYETAEPYFGDMGTGVIGDNGEAEVEIESVFQETVSIDGYLVFLQGKGIYVKEKHATSFVVAGGEPGQVFDWEIKARQKGNEEKRLERVEEVCYGNLSD